MDNISKYLGLLENNLEKLEKKYNNLDEAELKEIKTISRLIKANYAREKGPIYKQIGETRKQIEVYIEKIENFSTFNSKIIGEVLEQLVTFYLGDAYCYQETIYHTYKKEDGWEYEVNEKVRILIHHKNKYEKYDCRINNFDKLIKTKKVIILDADDYVLNSNISFYRANDNRTKIESKIEYDDFCFIKDFIDKVIDYRMTKDIPNISKSLLQELLRQFLTERQDDIKNNYMQKSEEQHKVLMKQIEQIK